MQNQTRLDEKIIIETNSSIRGLVKNLPASKSISNRALILNALSGGSASLHNLSDANDTRLMLRLIQSPDQVINIEDAGTTMRFLTAYFAITGQKKTLIGTRRMQERPIGILVDALRSLGARISYQNKEGYPPLTTAGFTEQNINRISIRGDVSSQFISALMMIAPILPHGLTLELTGRVGSRPYIEMTAALMKNFGVNSQFSDNTIRIDHQGYLPCTLSIESDWSAASYWFAIAALSADADIRLPHLYEHSLQGDHVVRKLMDSLGVKAEMDNGFLRLTKKNWTRAFTWNFTHCPDLAQTVAVVCAAKGIEGSFTGLESLRIKETDRIAALKRELQKIGADLAEDSGRWFIRPSTQLPSSAVFETYEDHRMAMAFAPLATMMRITVNNPMVVKKSYPKFWRDLEDMGFVTTRE
jgi:3-phosphoshikimate 1-carboxyvinyltransferase